MIWMARRARSMSRRGRILTVILTALAAATAYGAVLLIPANVGAAAFSQRMGGAAPGRSPAAPSTIQTSNTSQTSGTSQAISGMATVGALFVESGSALGTHFCTASVVHSTHGDLAVTAAHCLTGIQGQVAFVPGYANGKKPYGVWQVTAVYTDQAWQSSQDPDDDVAFLRLTGASSMPIESITGAERLGTGWQEPALVQVIGYPDGTEQPVSCANWAKNFSSTQLEFDCDGYTDGTSGGPFLTGTSDGSGQRTIVGVIGGYEQGGNTPQVSYATVFGPAVAALYEDAEAGG